MSISPLMAKSSLLKSLPCYLYMLLLSELLLLVNLQVSSEKLWLSTLSWEPSVFFFSCPGYHRACSFWEELAFKECLNLLDMENDRYWCCTVPVKRLSFLEKQPAAISGCFSPWIRACPAHFYPSFRAISIFNFAATWGDVRNWDHH